MGEDRKNKVIQLVELLSSKECIQVAQLLKNDKQKKLFRYLRRSIENRKPIDIKEMFRTVFSEFYSLKKEFLLRNEMRHLSKLITAFLSRQLMLEETNEREPGRYYLKALAKRKSISLLEKEADKILKEYIKTQNYAAAEEIIELMINSSVITKEATRENYMQLLKLSAKRQELLKRQFTHDLLNAAKQKAFIERTLKALNPDYHVSELEAVYVTWNENSEDDYSRYMLLLIQSYSLSGKEKILKLKQAASLLKKINKHDLDIHEATASIDAAIALEYFLTGDYALSLKFHLAAIEQSAGLEAEKQFPYLFNYLSTVLRLQRFKESLEIIDRYQEIWLQVPRMRDRVLCLQAMCYIFLNQPDRAYACIPLDRKQSGTDHYYYFRVIQIIAYFLRNDWELALNEADNFLHTINYQKIDDHYKALVTLIKKYLNLVQEKMALTETAFSKKKKTIVAQFEKVKTRHATPHNALLYLWLEKELKDS